MNIQSLTAHHGKQAWTEHTDPIQERRILSTPVDKNVEKFTCEVWNDQAAV